MIYPLDSELAKEIGVLEAIILVQFRYWIERNIANEQNYHDGNWWTYNSMVAFQRMFPFASEKSIRNALKHLEEKGLIITGNYNKLQYDRTKWYALTPLGITHTDNFTDSIRQKGQMETAKRANGNGKKGRPIPNKETNKETKNISSSLRSEDIYGSGSGKSKKGNLHSNPSLRPTLEEVKAYIDEKGYSVDAKKFFNYFDEGEWIDGKGQPVRSWKQKIITWEQNNGNRKDTNPGRGKEKRTGVAERIERGFDDFPRFREAGES